MSEEEITPEADPTGATSTASDASGSDPSGSDTSGSGPVGATAATGAKPDPHAASVVRLAEAMRHYALVPGAVVGVLGVVLSSVLVGWQGALGAFTGAVVAFASSLGTLWLMRKSAAAGPHIAMSAALGGFVGKMVVLFLVMVAVRGVEAFHPLALALTMLGVIVVWAAAEVRAFQKTKVPTIIPASSDG